MNREAGDLLQRLFESFGALRHCPRNQGTFGAQQWQAGVRNDDNDQFGNHTTGTLGSGMALGNDFRLSANYGTGFKAPTFSDLYDPWSGVPSLKPEESESLNLGLAQTGANWNWALDVYETRIDDLISYDGATFMMSQVERARTRGAEFTVNTFVAGWDLAIQLSHVDPRNDSAGPQHDNLLARRARNTARAGLDRSFGDFRVGATLNAAGERFDDAANNVRLGGYGTVDLRVEYAFNTDWSVQARATNLLDRDYETVAWYNQSGREYGLRLKYQPTRRASPADAKTPHDRGVFLVGKRLLQLNWDRSVAPIRFVRVGLDGHSVGGQHGRGDRAGRRAVPRRRQLVDGGFGGGDQLGTALFGNILPMAIQQRAFERIEQVESGLEARALDQHEGLDRADFGQLFTAVQTNLPQPSAGLGTDIAQLILHASESRKIAAIASIPVWSSASKRLVCGLSISNTPISSLPRNSGTTSSDREAESQATWPSNSSTSATRWVLRVDAAAPQTPLSSAMRTQAGWPWNGPTTSSKPS